MGAEHTPGPWTVVDDSRVIDTRGFVIADVHETSILADWEAKLGIRHWAAGPGVAYIDRSDDEVAATTRLVAAAPEMLTALETLVSERPRCHQIEPGHLRCGRCDWCVAEALVVRLKGLDGWDWQLDEDEPIPLRAVATLYRDLGVEEES